MHIRPHSFTPFERVSLPAIRPPKDQRTTPSAFAVMEFSHKLDPELYCEDEMAMHRAIDGYEGTVLQRTG